MLNKQKIIDFKKLLESDFLILLEKYKKEYNDFFFNMSINRKDYDFGYFPICYDFNHFKINNVFEDKEIDSLIKFIYTQIDDHTFNLKICFELNELLEIKFERTLSVLILEKEISCKESCLNNHNELLRNNTSTECLKFIVLKEEFIELLNDKINNMVQNYNNSKNIDWLNKLSEFKRLPVFNRKDYNDFLLNTNIVRYLNKKSFIHFKNVK